MKVGNRLASERVNMLSIVTIGNRIALAIVPIKAH